MSDTFFLALGTMDLKLQLWLIQAAFLVQKSSLPTLVNNSNFSESHPWQILAVYGCHAHGVKDTATSCRDRSSRATGDGGQTSVRQRFGRVSVVRPPTRGSGWKIGQCQWVENLHTHTQTYAHTSGISWQNPRRKNKHIVFWTLLHYGMSMLLFLQIFVRHINI